VTSQSVAEPAGCIGKPVSRELSQLGRFYAFRPPPEGVARWARFLEGSKPRMACYGYEPGVGLRRLPTSGCEGASRFTARPEAGQLAGSLVTAEF
jgi:hypothetical protein